MFGGWLLLAAREPAIASLWGVHRGLNVSPGRFRRLELEHSGKAHINQPVEHARGWVNGHRPKY